MLKKLYDVFSIVRIYEFMFNVVKKIASPLEPIVIPFFNWRLRPDRPLKPEKGSKLQLVIRPDEKAYVGWPVIKYLIGPFMRREKEYDEISNEVGGGGLLLRIIIVVPLMLAAFIFVIKYAAQWDIPILEDILPRGINNLNLDFLPPVENTGNLLMITAVILAVLMFLIWFIGLMWVYWKYEWERRHTVFAFFLGGLLHLEAKFIGRAVAPFFPGDNKKIDTPTPSDQITEIELATDVEDLPGGEYTSTAQDIWNQYLSKKYKIQTIRIASISRADDILRFVALAPSTLNCIIGIVDDGKLYINTRMSFKQKEQGLLSGEAGKSNYDPKAIARKASKVWEDFDKLYPQPVTFYENAFEIQDPGIWDRETGEMTASSKEELESRAYLEVEVEEDIVLATTNQEQVKPSQNDGTEGGFWSAEF